jgi:Fe-S cluster biogenesis protein NfuA
MLKQVQHCNANETTHPMTKIPAAIYAETTPNPNTMKFVANMVFTEKDRYEFTSMEQAKASPLAEKLFTFPFVKGVFIMSNFITVTKNDMVSWDEVMIEVREFIQNELRNGIKLISDEAQASAEEFAPAPLQNHTSSYNEIDQKIIDILDEYVKPGVESDGGHIAFQRFEEGIVHVLLQGACSGCPSSTMTLKAGIEGLLKNMLPEVQSVEAVNG